MISTADAPGPSARSHALRALGAAIAVAALLWSAAILLVPAVPALRTSPVAATLVYGTGALVCHQRSERSFHPAGAQMPVCARCSGLYLAGAAGALAAWFLGSGAPRRTREVLLLAVAPTFLTVGVEWLGLAAPSNLTRFAAALPAGGAAGLLIVRMLRAEADGS